MALSVVIIFRITATMTTFGFFPVAARRSWNALRAGFQAHGAGTAWDKNIRIPDARGTLKAWHLL
jgi:hypothetical protein